MGSKSGTSMTDSEIHAAYEARIDALFAGDAPKLKRAVILKHSDILDMLGYGDYPLHLDESKVKLNQTAHPEMTAAIWKKLPEWLENPAMVLLSRAQGKAQRLVFVPEETIADAPVYLIVEPDHKNLNVHVVINGYAKEQTGKLYIPAERQQNEVYKDIATDLAKGHAVYVDKEKARVLLGRSGYTLSGMPMLNTSRKKILTEKNLEGYRKNCLLTQAQHPQARHEQPLIDLTGLCPREAGKKLFAHTQGDLKHWDLMAASAQAAGLAIDRKPLEAVQGRPALLVQEAMVKALSATPKSAAHSFVKSKENTR